MDPIYTVVEKIKSKKIPIKLDPITLPPTNSIDFTMITLYVFLLLLLLYLCYDVYKNR